MTVPLSTIPTGQRFRVHAEPTAYTRCETLAWDATRDNPDHDLYGVDPQVQPRPDAVYCVRDGGVLVLMRPDAMVEPLPPEWAGQRYRVTVERLKMRDVFGADSLDTIRRIIRMFGQYADGHYVAIEDDGQHINVDGTPCREQSKGLQFRAVESRVNCGSVVV